MSVKFLNFFPQFQRIVVDPRQATYRQPCWLPIVWGTLTESIRRNFPAQSFLNLGTGYVSPPTLFKNHSGSAGDCSFDHILKAVSASILSLYSQVVRTHSQRVGSVQPGCKKWVLFIKSNHRLRLWGPFYITFYNNENKRFLPSKTALILSYPCQVFLVNLRFS